MSATEKIKHIIEQAMDGPLPKALVGVGDRNEGKIDVIARLSYIAGMKRAIEIMEQYEQDERDEKAERLFTRPINPDPVTAIARDAKK